MTVDDWCPRHDDENPQHVCTCGPDRVRQRTEQARARKAAPAGLAKARAALEQAQPRSTKS